ncbi:retron St85 family RNA-directed DNA polymerase [Bacillus safensis]|uniref:retron St85 family RNA-directed DNA polymerase n=1 Tax=Bacillus safensis TaxID=561879 RepID=UPI000B42DFCA|nr:retron St85 family RNA-directed DNA polymerase [Bacillus safensis]UDB46120.1 retron St85 family RNA-directed DNA polymerase [Bacillus safensis]
MKDSMGSVIYALLNKKDGKMDLAILESKMIEQNIPTMDIESTISYARALKDNGVPVIFDIQHLRRLLRITKSDFKRLYYAKKNQYKTVEIPKNNGTGSRLLSIPSIDLKYIQRWILDNILYKVEINNLAIGFAKGKSVVVNASYHIKQEYVLKMDIKDFFPNITANRVFGLFKSLGYSSSVAITLTNLCTYNDSLPQGAPTSPYISNLICRKLDSRLKNLCQKRNLNFSRYADDITISGGKKVKNTIPCVEKILEEEGFNVNEQKTRIIFKSKRQQVTGIVVNEKLSVPKSIYKNLRQEIYYMSKFGVESHLDKKGLKNKSHVREHYYGLANYFLMVDRVKGEKVLSELNSINWND